MNITEKTNRVIIQITQDKKVVIPSRMFPLEDREYRVISEVNTRPILDKKIIEIFDGFQSRPGHCFTSSEELVKSLCKAGYPAIQYVGWMLMDDGNFPIHHSFVMIEDHILDLSVNILQRDIDEMNTNIRRCRYSLDEIREYMISRQIEKASVSNHKKCNFGQCDSMYLYIAAKGTAEQGIQRNKNLRMEYPNHPSFSNVTNGLTPIQRKLKDRNLL